MIKIFAVFLMVAYVVFSIYFLYIFKKNEFDLKRTFEFLKKKCKFCSMLKNVKKETDVIEIKTEEGVKKIEIVKGDMENCEAPLGFPFDICFDPNNMTEEDKELREKLIQILSQRKQYIIDGGKKKLVIPLEATQFLTKNLNPLVNEYGEIIIVPKEKPILEQLRHAAFTIKNLDIELEDEIETELVKNLEMLKKLERVHHEKLEKIQEKKRKSRKDRKKAKSKLEKKGKDSQEKKNPDSKKGETNKQDTQIQNQQTEQIVKKTAIKVESTTTIEESQNKENSEEALNNQNENAVVKDTAKDDLNEETIKSTTKEINDGGVHAHQETKTNDNKSNEDLVSKESSNEKDIENNKTNEQLDKKTEELSFDLANNSTKEVKSKNNKEENRDENGVHAHHPSDMQNKSQDTDSNINNENNLEKQQTNNQNMENEKDSKEENLLDFNLTKTSDRNKTEAKTDNNNTEQLSNDLNELETADAIDNPTADIVENAIEKKEEIVASENENDKAKEMLNQTKIDMKTIQEFYTNVLQYKHLYEPPVFNKENLVKNLSVLNDRIGIGLFFNNLAKTTPLIYTDNKESVFADWKNIYIAFAMLYGSEFKSVITALLAPKMEEKIQFNKALAYVLSDYIDDHFTGESEFCSIVLTNKKTNQKFRAYGVFFLMKGFKLGLKENQIDFFRSFPYNNLYKIETIAKGLNLFEKKYPVLVGKPNEVLIK